MPFILRKLIQEHGKTPKHHFHWSGAVRNTLNLVYSRFIDCKMPTFCRYTTIPNHEPSSVMLDG